MTPETAAKTAGSYVDLFSASDFINVANTDYHQRMRILVGALLERIADLEYELNPWQAHEGN